MSKATWPAVRYRLVFHILLGVAWACGWIYGWVESAIYMGAGKSRRQGGRLFRGYLVATGQAVLIPTDTQVEQPTDAKRLN